MARRYVIGTLIAALAVYLLATRVDLGDSLGLLKGVEPVVLIPCSGIYLLAHMFRALRFRTLLGEDAPRFAALMAVVSIHNFLNQVMPVRTGETAYPVLVRKVAGVGYSKGISTLLLVRLYDLSAFFCIFILAMVYTLLPDAVAVPVRVVAVCAAGGAAVLFFRYLDSLVMGVAGFCVKVSGGLVRRGVCSPGLHSRAGRLAEDLKALESGGNYFRVAAYSLCLWLLTYAMFHVFVMSTGVDAGFLDTIIGSSGAVATSLLPVNTFGSVGTLEAGWTGGLVLAGVSKEAALASGILMHAFVIVFGLLLSLCGGFYLRVVHKTSGDTGQRV